MWHFAKISKRVEQITCQISIVLLLLNIILVCENGREAVQSKMQAYLVDFVRKIASWRRVLHRNVDYLRQGLRNRWRNACDSAVSPSSFVNHLRLLVNRLSQRFNGRHRVLRVEVINRRLDNSRRHEDRILLIFPLNLSVLLVLLSDLVHLLRVLHDHDDSLIIEMIGGGRRCDSGWDIESIDLHQLLDGHDMDLDVLVLPSEDLLLVVGIVGNVLEDLVVLGFEGLEPAD